MEELKNVRFEEEVATMMDQMMRAPIFRIGNGPPEFGDSPGVCQDPNVIMDLRHKTIGQSSFPVPSLTKSAALAEVTRMIMDKETRDLYRKREEELLNDELEKFEKGLWSSRPRFRSPYACCKRKIVDNLDEYEELWKMAPRRVKVKVKDISKVKDMLKVRDTSKVIGDEKSCERSNLENSCSNETIKVTIMSKPTSGCQEKDEEMLRLVLRALLENAKDERRLRESKLKLQEAHIARRMRKFFDAWREGTKNSKRNAEKKKNEREMSEERKIELFVNAINEKHKKLIKIASVTPSANGPKNVGPEAENRSGQSEGRKKSGNKKILPVVEPPATNRLIAQRQIIAHQKMKLAEQNRIIEELRLKKSEDEARKIGKDTINVAKDALAHCGHRTRRTLIQLMREEGYRDKSLLEPPRIPSPPRFLARMEARAEARRERVKLAEEERKRKLEEQKAKEESARREEEENRKRLQIEAQREAKRIREEQERKRALEMERSRKMNELAENFYRKYLLRRYVIGPLISLVESKRNYGKLAEEHYDRVLLKKIVEAWRVETSLRMDAKFELSLGLWRRNVLWLVFSTWLEATRCEMRKFQVAVDFCDLRRQEKCLREWSNRATELRIARLDNERLASLHFQRSLKNKCFVNWRKFLNIADEIRESDMRKEMWRGLVQRIVPDFDPKHRGVRIDD